ncbi:penicillin-binding protein 1A [Salinicola acroporae]|uniref:penicillin-binding protein 1A n=1 Tax=Salinicola acroporae TaxID=1541440 RepID=UPI0031BB86AB
MELAVGDIQSGGSTITIRWRATPADLDQTFTARFARSCWRCRWTDPEQAGDSRAVVNKIYLGHRSYGVAAAANTYGKPLADLTLRSTHDRGPSKAPSSFNPLANRACTDPTQLDPLPHARARLDRQASYEQASRRRSRYLATVYGVAAAANTYYGKPLADLTLPQYAMIAGLPKAPSSFNPLANPERALIRRNWILYRMRELGSIDQASYEQAVKAPITASRHIAQSEVDAPYVAEMARAYAVERFGDKAYTDNIRITTTLDSRLQTEARNALVQGLIDYDTRHGWRGPEEKDVPPSLVEAQDRTERQGLEEELSESPEVIQTARQAAQSSEANIEGVDGDVSNWLKVLERTPAYGPLQPAIVTETDGKQMHVLNADGKVITLDWDGLKWARVYHSAKWRGDVPANAEAIAQRGDLVRILKSGDTWRLSQRPGAEGAIVVLDPQTGAIEALQGGFSFAASKFNRAIQAQRQVGSNFKPFVYLAALQEGGMTAATIINDAPVVMSQYSGDDWRPENAERQFQGPTRLRVGLYTSRNLVTIRVLQSLGLDNALNFLERFGFSRDRLPHGLSLALGSASLTPLEIANAYAVLANGGFQVSPWYIQQVTQGSQNTVVEKANPLVACRDCAPDATQTEVDGEPRRIAPGWSTLMRSTSCAASCGMSSSVAPGAARCRSTVPTSSARPAPPTISVMPGSPASTTRSSRRYGLARMTTPRPRNMARKLPCRSGRHSWGRP